MTNKATADDLRSLVADLRPRSPKDVMGDAASSSLASSTVTAAIAGLGLVLGFTVLMFFLGASPANKSNAAKVAASASADETSGDSAADTKPVEPVSVAPTGMTPTGMTPAETAPADTTESAVEAMGIGEAKTPDSETDSLENRLDKILDGLE